MVGWGCYDWLYWFYICDAAKRLYLDLNSNILPWEKWFYVIYSGKLEKKKNLLRGSAIFTFEPFSLQLFWALDAYSMPLSTEMMTAMMFRCCCAWQIRYHPDYESSRCLFIVRKDGELVDFSYWKCIKSLIRKKYPLHAESFILRHFRRGRNLRW